MLSASNAPAYGVAMIRSLKFINIPVSDQARALAFYTEKLGFKVLTDQPMGPGLRWIELRIPGAETGVALFTPPGHEDRVGTFLGASFACDDLDETYERFLREGVECLAPPDKQPWGTSLKIKDSEGNVLHLAGR